MGDRAAVLARVLRELAKLDEEELAQTMRALVELYPPKRTKNAERQERHRRRKAEALLVTSQVTSRETPPVTSLVASRPPSPSPSLHSPSPSYPPQNSQKMRASEGEEPERDGNEDWGIKPERPEPAEPKPVPKGEFSAPMADDAELPEDWAAAARILGLQDVEKAWREFRAHYIAKGQVTDLRGWRALFVDRWCPRAKDYESRERARARQLPGPSKAPIAREGPPPPRAELPELVAADEVQRGAAGVLAEFDFETMQPKAKAGGR